MDIVNSIISADMLKKAEEDSKFVVISYDLPSENFISKKDDKEATAHKKALTRKRMEVGYYFYKNCVRLNQSVYVANKEKVKGLIEIVENAYEDVPKKYSKNVNVKVVGSVYEQVIEQMLVIDMDNLLKKIKEELELLEADITQLSEPKWNNKNSERAYERKRKSLINRAYRIAYKEEIVKNRASDLSIINKEKGIFYLFEKNKLKDVRHKIIRRI